MRKFTPLLLFVLFSATGPAGQSQASSRPARQSSSPATVTTVVTALGPNFSAPPPIVQQDVNVYVEKARQSVSSWMRAEGDHAGMQFAILIDDTNSPSTIGIHFNEIKNFINSQPPTTEVGIFYAQSGTTRTAANFSSDHEAVAQKLRLPLGRAASVSPSIYLSVGDFVSHWPQNGMRHEMLVMTSGVDYLYPGLADPYASKAIARAETAGVVVYTIYTGGSGLANTRFRMDIAWQNLTQLAENSGGIPFFQGLQAPVNLIPILRQLQMALNHQYLVRFDVPRSTSGKGQLRDISLRLEERSVALHYAQRVFVPGL
ncbi:MAG TPA: hypothetical protein VEJ67_18075 [Candidatus Cybelea sp.]|nr:hypothetical protein [Candidatus Cybelea sp.]